MFGVHHLPFLPVALCRGEDAGEVLAELVSRLGCRHSVMVRQVAQLIIWPIGQVVKTPPFHGGSVEFDSHMGHQYR